MLVSRPHRHDDLAPLGRVPSSILVCCPGGSQRKGGADVSDQFARVDHLRDSYGVLIQIKQLTNAAGTCRGRSTRWYITT
jgi:hypothetical protein